MEELTSSADRSHMPCALCRNLENPYSEIYNGLTITINYKWNLDYHVLGLWICFIPLNYLSCFSSTNHLTSC